MIESDIARAALAEVDRRRGEATRLVLRNTYPRWWVATTLTVAVALAVQTDLRTQIPELNGWFTRWVVPAAGVLLLIGLALLAARRARVGARSGISNGPAGVAMVIAVATYLVVSIGVGMPLRLQRVPWDQTISAVCAVAALLVVWAIWRGIDAGRRA